MSNIDDLTARAFQGYEKRRAVFPKAVDGPFRRLKWAVMVVTLAIYYITPWLRWDRGPYAPDQAVLIDMANRRFYMFSIEIWPQEFYFVAGLLIMAGIGLFLVTSAVGRAWCGYACPQTVWTDLYQHVERWIDGDRNAQLRLQAAPWGPQKVAKRLSKWAIWLIIAIATGGAWIFYFADAPTLAREFVTGQAPFVAYATVGVLTATTFILGGFMREEVCIYMCPWPRIQSAMLDEKSLLVTYKHWRGEPRGSLKEAKRSPTPLGDCVDCNQCVAVCPTGIDIREGPQIGCITCALCIDACNNVMAQVGRPPNLIAYTTLDDAAAEQAGEEPRPVLKTLFRPRTLVYLGVWSAIGIGMLFALGTRERLSIGAIQQRNPPYVQLADGTVRNSFTVKLSNMESRPRMLTVTLHGLPGGTMWLAGESDRSHGTRAITVEAAPDAVTQLSLLVAAPRGQNGEAFALNVSEAESADRPQVTAREELRFERPAT